MLLLPGAPALSRFRLDKILAALRSIDPRVGSLTAHFHHFVDLARPLAAAESHVLARLLESDVAPAVASGGARLLVMPRPGTISPWSSKATDIARVCGLDAVRRIERGTLYSLHAAGDLGRAELVALGGVVHDRMTRRRSASRASPMRSDCSRTKCRARSSGSRSGMTGARHCAAPTHASALRCRATRSTIWSMRTSAWRATRPMSS